MSVTLSGQLPVQPAKRVRHHVRDGAAVVAFSAVSSTALALALVLLGRLA